MKKQPSISIFFPFLNDWGTVGSLVALAISTTSRLTDDWEIIIVNDGSKKEDREALEMIVKIMNSKRHSGLTGYQLVPVLSRISTSDGDSGLADARQNDNKGRVKIIDHEKNRGYGGALRSGFALSTKDLIFYTDCDAQYDPRELEKLYKALKPDVDLVNGYKIKRSDPLHRIIVGRLYHYLVKFAFNLPIRDTDCDFRLIRRKVFNKVKLFENTGTICVELVKKIDYWGGQIVEVPVHHYWRTSGKSQFFNFKRLATTGINLLKLWWKLMVRKDYYN